LCGFEAAAERAFLDVVGARALAVDLHDGDPLAVRGLQQRVTVDRDLFQLEPELVPEGGDLGPRPVAQVAAGRVVERYVRSTDRAPG
jgi:hypothetical protein